MAVVVNNRKNLPLHIRHIPLVIFKKFKISTEFLDKITKNPNNQIGIKRESYYILKTNGILRTVELKYEFYNLRSILEYCYANGIDMLMIKF